MADIHDEGFDKALIYMALGEKVAKDQWGQMVSNSKDALNIPGIYKKMCLRAEQNYVINNIEGYKRLKSGKPVVGNYLSTTYKQYKSRILTAMTLDIALVNENDEPVPSSEVQRAIANTKKAALKVHHPKMITTKIAGQYVVEVWDDLGKKVREVTASTVTHGHALVDEHWVAVCRKDEEEIPF